MGGFFLVFLLYVIFRVSTWILLHPDNYLTSLFRPKISNFDTPVVMGPYPVPADMRILKSHGVTALVTLLDPGLPYERILLEQERSEAEKYGMQVFNFPMTSVLGRRMGKDYDANAMRAAETVREQLKKGKVYLHCYLGLHRLKAVASLLEENGVKPDTYLVRKADRSEESRRLDEAQAAFDAGNFAESKRLLLEAGNPSESARLLLAWSHFKLGEVERAEAVFAPLSRSNPECWGCFSGLGFCALRKNQLEEASQAFSWVLKNRPDDIQALEGQGHLSYRRKNWKLARSSFEKVLEKNPDQAEIREILGRIPR